MRVVLIASERTVSDYIVFLEHLLVGLLDESIATLLICPADCQVECVGSGPIQVIQHPAVNLPLMRYLDLSKVTEQVEKFRPTVLHCLCESKAAFTRRLARRLDVPYVLAINSLIKRRWLSVSSRRCVKMIAPTQSIAAHLKKTYPRFADRIEQINMGTFVEEDRRCFSDGSCLAAMVTACPLNKVADFETLFSAVRNLAIDGYEFMLVAMGGGRAERQLWKLLAAYGITEHVTIVPRLNPWRAVLAAGDIFVQPRPSLAFNGFLLEAMSVGTAVAACSGGVDDFILPEQTAVVFDPDNELSVRGALQRLLDRQDMARRLAGSAQEYVKENHTVSNMISATLEAYAKV